MPIRTRRSAGSLRRSSQRRKLVWATSDNSVTIPAGQISNVNLLSALSVAGSSLLGITIIRTHLRLQMPQSNAEFRRIGLIVGRATDVGINVAGQQDPSNPELDWMLLDRVGPSWSGATVDSQASMVYDLRAKRKMQELNQAYILALAPASAAANTIQIWARTLIALP